MSDRSEGMWNTIVARQWTNQHLVPSPSTTDCDVSSNKPFLFSTLKRVKAQAQQVSNFGEILTGVQSVSDPMTGGQFQVTVGQKPTTTSTETARR